MLDLKRLMIFREVARQSSFSEAACTLSYSQPAVSHHISRLERELDARLLERSSRGDVRLTDAGRVLFRHAEALLAAASNAEMEVAEVVGNRECRVRLGAFATGAATIVADAIARFRSATPSVKLTLFEGEAPGTISALKARSIDLALIFDDPEHPLGPDEQLDYRHLYDDPMLLALPVGHRLAATPVIPLAALEEESWIEGAGEDTPCSLILASACRKMGFEPRVGFSSGNYSIVQRMVTTGVGVAMVPELALTNPDPRIVLRRLDPEPRRRVILASNHTAYHSEAVKAMAAAIEEVCESYAAGRDARVVAMAAS
jgi:DNA-binding transcriptional LysR family regulator